MNSTPRRGVTALSPNLPKAARCSNVGKAERRSKQQIVQALSGLEGGARTARCVMNLRAYDPRAHKNGNAAQLLAQALSDNEP